MLSNLYPAGFGVDLIDRAESLGKSIFDFVEQAKAENKTILASIVGEKPAQVPADVGVFVVGAGWCDEVHRIAEPESRVPTRKRQPESPALVGLALRPALFHPPLALLV